MAVTLDVICSKNNPLTVLRGGSESLGMPVTVCDLPAAYPRTSYCSIEVVFFHNLTFHIKKCCHENKTIYYIAKGIYQAVILLNRLLFNRRQGQ